MSKLTSRNPIAMHRLLAGMPTFDVVSLCRKVSFRNGVVAKEPQVKVVGLDVDGNKDTRDGLCTSVVPLHGQFLGDRCD